MKSVICMVIVWWLWESWDNRLSYSVHYNVPMASVEVAPRPHDCEWGSAPLGDKHCKYKELVSAVRVKKSGDGKWSYVSYDEGKTWVNNESHIQPSVWVSWTKVEE